MPRAMLDSYDMDLIVIRHFKKNGNWEKREVSVDIAGLPEGMNVVYFYNQQKNAVIVPSPLAVIEGDGDAIEPSYQATIQAISKVIGDNFTLGTSLLGKGAGERHYTAMYRALDGKISMFDSKISEPERFLNSSNAPNFFEIIWGGLSALFQSFGLWAFGIGKQVHATFLNQDMLIHRLETQPLFDGVSCGLYSAGAVMVMADLIDNNQSGTEDITLAITGSEYLDIRAETILNDSDIPSVSSALGSMAKSDKLYEENDSLPEIIQEQVEVIVLKPVESNDMDDVKPAANTPVYKFI